MYMHAAGERARDRTQRRLYANAEAVEFDRGPRRFHLDMGGTCVHPRTRAPPASRACLCARARPGYSNHADRANARRGTSSCASTG